MPGIRFFLSVSLFGALACCGCGSSPATPSAPPTPSAPTPTKAPSAPATTKPDVPPAGSGCRKPYPPPISRFNVKVHMKWWDYWNLDSTPLVGRNPGYCRSIGFTDGRSECPVRPEGAPDRVACENWRVGKAKDTGVPGPTWIHVDAHGKESYCLRHIGGVDLCRHHPGNLYQLDAIEHGSYKVCTESGVCGSVYVDR